MEVLFYIGFALFVLFGPWILLWRVNSRRKNDRLEDQLRWADIAGRIHALERELRELRATGTAQAPVPVAGPTTPVQTQPSVPPPPTPSLTPSQATAEAWVTRRTSEAPRVISTPSVPKPATPPSAPVASPALTPAPTFAPQETGPTIFDRFRSSLDIEEMLGTDWLNKVGIVLVVLGVAFFLAYQLKTMGPAGKVLVGFVTSAVLLGAGIWFERGDRYRILARAGIGGG